MSLIYRAVQQPAMGKLDRAMGALCVALAGFGVVAGSMSMHAARSVSGDASGLAVLPGGITLVLALLAAIPGFFLLLRKGTV